MKFKQWLLGWRRIFWVWWAVAVIVWLAVYIITAPYGTKLGVPSSPQRQTLWLIMDFWVLKLPMVLLAASYVASRNNWLAPRGRYVEGKEYPVFSTYIYTAIAFMAALFAVSGIVNFQLFDVPAGPATLAITVFNPIVGFFTLWLGGVIRALVFGSGNPVQWLLAIGLSDGATWIVLGLFYWWFRSTRWGQNVIGLFVGWSIFYVVWRTLMTILIILWVVPANLYVPSILNYVTTLLLPGYLVSLVGLVIAEAIIRTLERGRGKSPAVRPTM
jgi:hypothetical protein